MCFNHYIHYSNYILFYNNFCFEISLEFITLVLLSIFEFLLYESSEL
jgi:hypothetical protein